MAGEAFLARSRRMDDKTRVMSIASYECGGLERVFRAMLRAPDWNTALLQAFRHFLIKHIGFDSDPEQGHGLLIRHITDLDLDILAAIEIRQRSVHVRQCG